MGLRGCDGLEILRKNKGTANYNGSCIWHGALRSFSGTGCRRPPQGLWVGIVKDPMTESFDDNMWSIEDTDSPRWGGEGDPAFLLDV